MVFVGIQVIRQLQRFVEDNIFVADFHDGGFAPESGAEDREGSHSQAGFRPDGDAVLRLILALAKFAADVRRCL